MYTAEVNVVIVSFIVRVISVRFLHAVRRSLSYFIVLLHHGYITLQMFVLLLSLLTHISFSFFPY